MKQQDEAATKKDLEKVEQRLQNVESGLQEVEERLTAKIDANGAKIDANSGTLSRLTSLALNNQAEIKKIVTRDEFNRRMDEVISGQDKMVQIFMHLDEERVAATARVDRIEGDVQENKLKIQELQTKIAR